MKTPLLAADVTHLNSPAVMPVIGAVTDSSSMMLSEVEDEHFQRLPPIHPPARPHGVRRTSSARSQYPAAAPDYASQQGKAVSRARSLLDIHEESVDNDVTSPAPSTSQKTSTSEASHSQALRIPPAQVKLLESRENCQKASCTSSKVTPRHCRLRHMDPNTILPNKHRRRPKSLSQRDFYEDDEADNTSTLPCIYRGRGHQPADFRNRSMSETSFLPTTFSSPGLSLSKSISQPDISKRSRLMSLPHSASDLTESSSKERVQKLWQRAGQMLRSPRDAQENPVPWVEAPGGGLLRPAYSRWQHRRHALAEPERMCMTQPVRERILKDVEIRRRSMKRRVSQFFTIKLGLNMEEDLIA